jgi:hypothetical protein
MRRNRFDPAGPDRDIRAGDSRRLSEKGGFSAIRLYQFNLAYPEDGKNQPGKSGAATKIDKASRCGRDQREKLRGIKEMAAPQIVKRGPTDKIDPRRPADQHVGIRFKPFACFT